MPNELMKTLTIGANTYDLPQKTSDLTNDSGFITSETDPTVPSWAKASSKPTYTANEVGAVPKQAKAGAGASVSNITNSATYITLSESTSSMGGGTLSMELSQITLTALSSYQGTSATITLVTDPAGGTAINNIILSDGTTTINGVVTPTTDGMAANKKYVDDSITAAIGTAIGGSY